MEDYGDQVGLKMKGYVLLVVSVFAFVAANLIIKELYNFMSVAQSNFVIRILSIITTFSKGTPSGLFQIGEYKKAVVPTLCITSASLLWSYGINFTNPGDCITIVSMLPLCTAVIGFVFFGKNFPKRGFWESALACFSGCILLVQPAFLFGSSPTTSNDLIGYSFILVDLFFYASYILCTEFIDIDPIFLVFVTATVRCSLFGMLVLWEQQWSPINGFCWLLMIISACSLTVGGVSRTMATRITGSVPAAFFVLLETPATYFFQYIFFNFPVNLLQLVGVAVILTGVIYFIHISNVKEKQEGLDDLKEDEL